MGQRGVGGFRCCSGGRSRYRHRRGNGCGGRRSKSAWRWLRRRHRGRRGRSRRARKGVAQPGAWTRRCGGCRDCAMVLVRQCGSAFWRLGCRRERVRRWQRLYAVARHALLRWQLSYRHLSRRLGCRFSWRCHRHSHSRRRLFCGCFGVCRRTFTLRQARARRGKLHKALGGRRCCKRWSFGRGRRRGRLFLEKTEHLAAS